MGCWAGNAAVIVHHKHACIPGAPVSRYQVVWRCQARCVILLVNAQPNQHRAGSQPDTWVPPAAVVTLGDTGPDGLRNAHTADDSVLAATTADDDHYIIIFIILASTYAAATAIVFLDPDSNAVFGHGQPLGCKQQHVGHTVMDVSDVRKSIITAAWLDIEHHSQQTGAPEHQ